MAQSGQRKCLCCGLFFLPDRRNRERQRYCSAADCAAASKAAEPALRAAGDASQPSTFKPCFSTTASSLSAMPLGRLVPASHFCTVDSLVFR